MIINENRLHGSIKILENKVIQMSKDPKYILDGATLKFDKQPITITKTGSDRIEGTIFPTLVDGRKLNAAINPNATSFIQHRWGNPPDASDGIFQIIDISEAQNGSIITWFNLPEASGDFGKPGEQCYWSKYGEIYMNPDSARAFSSLKNMTYIDLSGMNTSKVINMGFMFYQSASLYTIYGLSYFDTSNVTDMYRMFDGCSKLTALDLSHFNTSKVTDMWNMFSGCESLTALDVSSFDTSNVTDMNEMFIHCEKLTSLNLSSFDTSKVLRMKSMFGFDRLLATITYGPKFVNTSILDMDKTDILNGTYQMFNNTIANKPNWTDGVWDENGTFNNKNTTLAAGYVINSAIDTNATSFIRSTTPPDGGGSNSN